jgi:hypothetical protein
MRAMALLYLASTTSTNMATQRSKLKSGDKVRWNTSRGKTTGVVVKKLTSPTRIKSHEVSASKENPEYLVESCKSGKQAAHKPKALKKVN